jgi:2-hydroxychromene-2-carboxylate isomerase
MSSPVIEYWFDFGSSYAYFASFEIEALAARHGRTVAWRPFMLGTAFDITGARGLSKTPLKRDYALHDWARISRLRGVPFALPAHHPSVAVPAMRAFYHYDKSDPALAVAFAKAVFAAYFQAGADIGDAGQVCAIAAGMGQDAAALAEALTDPALKALAKARSQEAVDRGAFGSPWFFVDGEPFWGWDRLPMIDDWLSRGGW